MIAALILTEVLAEAKDSGKLLLVTFMDSSKAFDIVNHASMLNALFEHGIKGELWSLYNNLYQEITSSVKWDGWLSSPFQENQGIRQGGITSPALYKTGRNKGLDQLDKNPTMPIGSLNAGALMVADDLVLTASSPEDMQLALTIAETDAGRERYIYNPDKTKILVINGKKCNPELLLNNKPLGISIKEKHLGIIRNSKNTNEDTIKQRITDARRACYSLLGAGLCGLNGTGPEVALSLYSTYVIPLLLYGLKALVPRDKDLQTLETYHRPNIRHILHLPPSTASPAISS